MKKLINVLTVLTVLLTICLLTGCSDSFQHEQKTIHISAAASLKGPVMEWKKQFEKKHPNTNVACNFASSGVLIQQIEKGAPADFLFSAQEADHYLNGKHSQVYKKRGILATNELVFVAGKAVEKPVKTIDQLPKNIKFGIGDPKLVPAGFYANKAIGNLNMNKNDYKMVLAQNAVHLKGLVESGAVDYALMYRTDAMESKKIRILTSIPQDKYPKIEYPIYQINQPLKEAKEFLNYVKSKKGQLILKKFSFRESVQS